MTGARRVGRPRLVVAASASLLVAAACFPHASADPANDAPPPPRERSQTRVSSLSVRDLLRGAARTLGAQAPITGAMRPDEELVFLEEFTGPSIGPGLRWGWKTGAYPGCVTNRPNWKLDHLDPSAITYRHGKLRIRAAPRPDGDLWTTGLLTTGDSCGSGGRGFQVRTDDLVVARLRLPTARVGAWPAIWTWRDGRNEIDVFEWHSDRPHRLEFVNHVRGGAKFWTSPIVRPGAWLDVAVRLGPRSLTWYVAPAGEQLVPTYSDTRGVGTGFHAHLVVNLSINSGRYHPPPASPDPITFEVDAVRVYRVPDDWLLGGG
ncbi:glycoside hydrolase family 16 protein [Spirillospora sp. CA-294931]|uniref:glycoside hydrolase family 16 protein n=1 Tax=Spirillospora sp. CA-294931 TaxID=3240042 RepID=UPI003D93ECC2